MSSPRARRPVRVVDHLFAHELWVLVADSDAHRWPDSTLNPGMLDITYDISPDTYYRRRDESYPTPVKWHLYDGDPENPETPFMRGSPEADFSIHDVHTAVASIVAETNHGLRFTLVAEEDSTRGAAMLFARIAAPNGVARTIEQKLIENDRATLQDYLPDAERVGVDEVVATYDPSYDAAALLDYAEDALRYSTAGERAERQ